MTSLSKNCTRVLTMSAPHNNITQQRNTTHLQQHEDGQPGHYYHIHSDPGSQDPVLLHTPARGPVPVSGLLQVHEVHHSQRYKVDARIWEADIISKIIICVRGNLGNRMFTYITMYLLRLKFGYDTFITERIFSHLNAIFENVRGNERMF